LCNGCQGRCSHCPPPLRLLLPPTLIQPHNFIRTEHVAGGTFREVQQNTLSALERARTQTASETPNVAVHAPVMRLQLGRRVETLCTSAARVRPHAVVPNDVVLQARTREELLAANGTREPRSFAVRLQQVLLELVKPDKAVRAVLAAVPFPAGVNGQVRHELGAADKQFSAERARVRPDGRVHPELVTPHGAVLAETFPADRTRVRPLSGVGPHVHAEGVRRRKRPIAERAHSRLFAAVLSEVALQLVRNAERAVALRTPVRLQSQVNGIHVPLQVPRLGERPSTLVTAVRLGVVVKRAVPLEVPDLREPSAADGALELPAAGVTLRVNRKRAAALTTFAALSTPVLVGVNVLVLCEVVVARKTLPANWARMVFRA